MERDERCPKRMVYGPCGGVRADGSCELGDRPCPFVDRPLVTWTGPEAGGGPGHDRWAVPAGAAHGPPPALAPVPRIVADLRVRPLDVASVAAVAGPLGQACDALLVGDHHSRPDFPPAVMARLLVEAGATPWVTFTCRDRSAAALDSELGALAALGGRLAHCVTGDARARGLDRPSEPVFDLDALRLVARATEAGLVPSVAATPVAPPVELRPWRLLEKQRAGAEVCFVNHAGGPARVAAFVAAARAAGVSMPFVPCVAVFTDERTADGLASFPGLVLDPAERARVLDAADPIAAGIQAAVDQARQMLAIEGVVGVNLSGAGTTGDEMKTAEIMTAIATQLR